MENYFVDMTDSFELEEDNVEIPFTVEMPEGEISLEWVTDIVTRVTAMHLDLEVEDIDPTKRFQQDLNADSLDIVEINMKLEKMLDISVPDYYIGLIITVDDAARVIQKVLNEEPEEEN